MVAKMFAEKVNPHLQDKMAGLEAFKAWQAQFLEIDSKKKEKAAREIRNEEEAERRRKEREERKLWRQSRSSVVVQYAKIILIGNVIVNSETQ
jgi:hypothetical protein